MTTSVGNVQHSRDTATAIALHILDEVLAILRDQRGIDFTGYRRSTLHRRLTNRLIAAGAGSSGRRYVDLLRDSADEAERLVAALTVKVSRFYRNAAVFDALRDGLLADLGVRAGAPLRLWSAGCAQGEEAYTLAMVLGDLAGEVRGTDVDEVALRVAQAGRYPAAAFDELPASLHHFVVKASDAPAWSVAESVRRRVHFERHDLATGIAPGPRPFHLVSCRNVLIYFEADLQRRALRHLLDSVVPGGLLCLGEAEWPREAAPALEVVDRKLKIFRRLPADAEAR